MVKHDHGNKRFELKNHLGNVNTVLTDRRKNEGCVLNANYFVTSNDINQWNQSGQAFLSFNNGRMEIATTNLYHGAYKNFTVVPGETYRVQAKLTASAGHLAKLIVYDLPNWNFMGSQAFNSTTGMVDFIITPTSNTITVRIENLINGASASMFLDDFVLTQTSCPNFSADVVAAHDYYPFGWVMPGRSWVAANGAYRYGFNGEEKTDEIFGEYNLTSFTERLYNARLGKWLAIDGKDDLFPGYSPYVFTGNSPNINKEIDGDIFGTVIGGIVGAAVGAVVAYQNDEDVWAGAIEGGTSGVIAGAIVDITVASGGTALPVIIGAAAVGGAVGAAAGDVTGQITKNVNNGQDFVTATNNVTYENTAKKALTGAISGAAGGAIGAGVGQVAKAAVRSTTAVQQTMSANLTRTAQTLRVIGEQTGESLPVIQQNIQTATMKITNGMAVAGRNTAVATSTMDISTTTATNATIPFFIEAIKSEE